MASFDARSFPQVAWAVGREVPAVLLVMKTYSPKPGHIVRRWYVVDASGQVLGRLASEVAAILRGKHKPIFAPHMDTGDNVIVVNAEKIELTGAKLTKKVAYRHSGYPGGITATRYDALMANKPAFVIEKAVKGMLPKNSLGRSMVRKLHVVVGPEHPHQAQQPVPYTLGQPPMWEGLPQRPGPEGAAAPQERPAAAKPASKPASKKTTATSPPKTTAVKKTARKLAAKKPTAVRTPAARKTTARKTTAKKTAAKKTAARKPAAKRSAAKKDQEES
jgi:large subunit ribosomal protein L13